MTGAPGAQREPELPGQTVVVMAFAGLRLYVMTFVAN
jgi:hypothetical protein